MCTILPCISGHLCMMWADSESFNSGCLFTWTCAASLKIETEHTLFDISPTNLNHNPENFRRIFVHIHACCFYVHTNHKCLSFLSPQTRIRMHCCYGARWLVFSLRCTTLLPVLMCPVAGTIGWSSIWALASSMSSIQWRNGCAVSGDNLQKYLKMCCR